MLWQPTPTTGSSLSRRTFLADLGRGAVALTVVGIAGCAPSAGGSDAPSGSGTGGPASPAGSTAGGSTPPSSQATNGVDWERVNLGFVSAYILVRDGEAAVVDTGVEGSADDIATSLEGIDLGWGAVAHVILTHMHGDHAGSAAAVMDAAPAATGYAGAQDIPSIATPRPLTAVADGDEVFGLRVVATPGHTAGHIAVLDEVGGILVAGDAVRTNAGEVAPPGAQFTDDMDQAMASVAKMGALRFDTLLVGHGDPILTGAAALVAALAGG